MRREERGSSYAIFGGNPKIKYVGADQSVIVKWNMGRSLFTSGLDSNDSRLGQKAEFYKNLDKPILS
jgi:hypothetical protein